MARSSECDKNTSTDKTMKTVTEILEESSATYEKKNADYGQSWKNIGYILYMLANEQPVVLDSPEDWIAVGLFTRRMDKIARSFNMDLLDHDPNFEAATDADEDETVYAAMQAENKYDRERKAGEPVSIEYQRVSTPEGDTEVGVGDE